ncbi:MAG: T9SS type A sorting domain-containing protein, partial [Candidatus Cloacimonetes bacterium]|nr:T9SS type A sorting domain-containing protein [Candidatus Cloacimonadota bacterium]
YGNTNSITYSDFYNNQGGNFFGVNASIGVNVTTNVNGDSCDAYYNIQEDPLFVDPSNGDYNLSWTNYPTPDNTMSPCIDAGDPSSPLDPDGTIADIGTFYFNQNVSINEPQEISQYNLANYPNPISPNINNLTVSYTIHKPSKVKIQLFNIKGQLVSTLINEEKNIGDYLISHSISELSSGMYFTKMSIDGVNNEIKKVILLR